MPRDVHRGINSVKRFVRQHHIEGVHGTLIELIDCLPQLYTAVEVGFRVVLLTQELLISSPCLHRCMVQVVQLFAGLWVIPNWLSCTSGIGFAVCVLQRIRRHQGIQLK